MQITARMVEIGKARKIKEGIDLKTQGSRAVKRPRLGAHPVQGRTTFLLAWIVQIDNAMELTRTVTPKLARQLKTITRSQSNGNDGRFGRSNVDDDDKSFSSTCLIQKSRGYSQEIKFA